MYERYQQNLKKLKETGNYRFLRETCSIGSMVSYEGKKYLNFSSNDYLGISAQNDLWNMFMNQHVAAGSAFTGGACSSRLLTGNTPEYAALEGYLAQCYNRDTALVFNSGYHANIGILPALSSKNDLILADKLVHASIIDGLQLCDAKVIRYKHNDLQQLEEILENQRNHHEHVFIVTESVFSMDGDTANLHELSRLKSKYNAMLYVDEAHAIGVLGSNGLGLCESEGLISQIDFIVGTFGKAVASQGAYLVCDNIVREYLINTMRPLIFTTALPPISLQWTLFVMQHITEMHKEREYLASLSCFFRDQLALLGFETKGNSQIVPVIIGENSASVNISNYLLVNNIFVLPVRPPTVPVGSARLRFSVNAHMHYADIEKVLDLLKKEKYATSLV